MDKTRFMGVTVAFLLLVCMKATPNGPSCLSEARGKTVVALRAVGTAACRTSSGRTTASSSAAGREGGRMKGAAKARLASNGFERAPDLSGWRSGALGKDPEAPGSRSHRMERFPAVQDGDPTGSVEHPGGSVSRSIRLEGLPGGSGWRPNRVGRLPKSEGWRLDRLKRDPEGFGAPGQCFFVSSLSLRGHSGGRPWLWPRAVRR